MSLKLLLGVGIPIALIIALISLTSLGPGLNTTIVDVKQVDFSKLTSQNNVVLVRTVTISNNFFMPRRYELPPLIACLNDKQGQKQLQNVQITFDHVLYVEKGSIPIYGQIAESTYGDYYYGTSASSKSVEIPANGEKEIKVQVKPGYSYSSYAGYDEILVVEPKQTEKQDETGKYYSSRYFYCNQLAKEDLERASHIELLNAPVYTTTTTVYPYYYTTTTINSCYDTDGGINMYVSGYTTYPNVQNPTEKALDNCINNTLYERSCLNNRPITSTIECPVGYTCINIPNGGYCKPS